MRIHNLYTDASGQSHFRDIEVEWVEEGPAGKLSKRLPATGIIFRQVQPDYDLDWHPAPRRQYIINLDAGVQITASDGEARVIGAGEIVLVEDTTGKGHLSKAVGRQAAPLHLRAGGVGRVLSPLTPGDGRPLARRAVVRRVRLRQHPSPASGCARAPSREAEGEGCYAWPTSPRSTPSPSAGRGAASGRSRPGGRNRRVSG